jgi:hypothetical protein
VCILLIAEVSRIALGFLGSLGTMMCDLGKIFQRKLLTILQNIGGFSPPSKMLKDEIIRNVVSTWEFDIMGFAETNIDW